MVNLHDAALPTPASEFTFGSLSLYFSALAYNISHMAYIISHKEEGNHVYPSISSGF
jgi:hypothetical protein